MQSSQKASINWIVFGFGLDGLISATQCIQIPSLLKNRIQEID